jgi:hypothetical protein
MQVDVNRHPFTIAHCQNKGVVSKTSLVQSNRIITTQKRLPYKLDRKVLNGVKNDQQTSLFTSIPHFNLTIPTCQFMIISISRYDPSIKSNKNKFSPVSSLECSKVRKNHTK